MRAKPERSLMDIGGNHKAFEGRAVELIEPQINAMYIMSSEIEQKMNRLKGQSLTYSDYPLRNVILTDGLSEYNLTLSHGKN